MRPVWDLLHWCLADIAMIVCSGWVGPLPFGTSSFMTSMQYHVSSGIMEPVNCVQVFYMVCYEQHRPPVPEDTPPEYVALLTKVRTSVPCTFHSPPCQLSCVLWVGGLCLALTAIMLLDTMLRYHARMFAETSFPITQCWEHDPTQRPTFSYIMKTLMDQFSVLRAAKPPAAAADNNDGGGLAARARQLGDAERAGQGAADAAD